MMMRMSAVMVTVGLMALAAGAGAQQPAAPPAPDQWGVSAQPAPTAPWTPPQRPGAERATPQQAVAADARVLPLRVIPVMRGNPELIAELMGGYAIYDEGAGAGQMGGGGGYGGFGGRTTDTRDTRGRGYTDRGVGYSDPRTTRGTTTGRTTGLW